MTPHIASWVSSVSAPTAALKSLFFAASWTAAKELRATRTRAGHLMPPACFREQPLSQRASTGSCQGPQPQAPAPAAIRRQAYPSRPAAEAESEATPVAGCNPRGSRQFRQATDRRADGSWRHPSLTEEGLKRRRTAALERAQADSATAGRMYVPAVVPNASVRATSLVAERITGILRCQKLAVTSAAAYNSVLDALSAHRKINPVPNS
jgi:hypothetical protein